jgi:hypothetical protein
MSCHVQYLDRYCIHEVVNKLISISTSYDTLTCTVLISTLKPQIYLVKINFTSVEKLHH